MGEAKRRKQQDSSYGKLDKRIATLRPEDNALDIYNDPNILVGSGGEPVPSRFKRTEAEAIHLSGKLLRQIRESEQIWQIWHEGRNSPSLMLLNPPERVPPVIIHSFSDRNYYWELDSNPMQWCFKPSVPNIQIKDSPPEEWDAAQIINDMRHWPTIRTTHGKSPGFKQLVERMRGQYLGLSLWQEYRVLRYEDLELVVLHTPLKTLRPFADFDAAFKLFADRLWEKSVPMAHRATSREHLWYCGAYSLMLGKMHDCGLVKRTIAITKDKVYEGGAELIAHRKKALSLIEAHDQGKLRLETEENLMLLSLEFLQEQNCDWREYIVWLLVDDAIKYAWYKDDKDLIHYCRQFLNSYSHYNRIINGKDSEEDADSSTYVCAYLNENQQLVTSQQHQST